MANEDTPGIGPRIIDFPSGLTFVCSREGHGKTLLMRNLALDTVRRNRMGKAVLYYSLDDKDSLPGTLESMLDIYGNTLGFLHLIGRNILAISAPMPKSAGIMKKMTDDTKRLRPCAVFIDSLDAVITGKRRHEELEGMVQRLDKMAAERNIPIIISMRMTADACSPCDLLRQYIDEPDLMRHASLAVMLWNSRFAPTRITSAFKGIRRDELISRGLRLGEPGLLYVLAEKTGSGSDRCDAIIRLDESTGRCSL